MPNSNSVSFSSLGLPTQLQSALAKLAFINPTPIQTAAIPPALEGRDVVGCAQTGTGKTAAFCIPLIARLLKDDRASALILAPTRELAEQISKVIQSLTADVPYLRSSLLIGGQDIKAQLRILARHPRILIATPGRLHDHLQRRTLNLKSMKVLVLDEGDRMLDMGFEQQVVQILNQAPKDRQTLLFSATIPEKAQKLVSKYLRNPVNVSVGESSKPVDKIEHQVLQATKHEKNDILLDQLNSRQGSVLIFVNMKYKAEKLNKYLTDYGYKVTRIHGGRTQNQRMQALEGFRKGDFRILVATDVAARGIDIPEISHVINFEIPLAAEDFVHRIGRTGRAGASGHALSFLTPDDHQQWRRISKECGFNAAVYGGGAPILELKAREEQRVRTEQGRTQKKATQGRPSKGPAGRYQPKQGNKHRNKSRFQKARR